MLWNSKSVVEQSPWNVLLNRIGSFGFTFLLIGPHLAVGP